MALAVLARSGDPRLAVPLLLGIAYGASVGGTGTLIGTPPNVIFAGVYQQATGQEYGFVRWMQTGLPVVILAIPAMALWLSRNLRGAQPIELRPAGAWRKPEVRVMVVFGITILAWITRSEPFGGWSGLMGLEGTGDSTVALAAVVVMFLVPDGEDGRLLDWKMAGSIPWGMLLLFAGGICIAAAFTVFLLILAICLTVTFLTEITSNTATATLLMPVLAAAAVGAKVAPELLMIPAAISASCAFMLPVATAPNAIVYATDRLTIAHMAREGFALNLIVAVIVATVSYFTLGR
jgi:sodium-dependent dicarboxylate transporter 2/3/5